MLNRLAKRNIYAITSFIIGLDNDTPGVAARTLEQIESWPPGLPVFGQLTPFPATPLFDRLVAAGRLTRPKHWLEFAPYQMAHEPLKMTIPQTQAELDQAWARSYSPERNLQVINELSDHPISYRAIHFIMRLFFRGIYFPQMNRRAWLKVIFQNRRSIFSLSREAISAIRSAKKNKKRVSTEPATAMNERRAA